MRYSRRYPNHTYIWKSAIAAGTYLGLIGIDEDAWMAGGATTTIARDDLAVCPLDGLLVNELDGSIWGGLRDTFARSAWA